MVSSLFSLLESPDTALATAPQPMEYVVTYPLPHVRNVQYLDFGVEIKDGVVWFWLLEQWQDLPKELWAWKLVTVWTEDHSFYGDRIWVPSLLLFDFWEYIHDPTSLPRPWVSTSIINHRSVPSITAIIAPRLFQILRSWPMFRWRSGRATPNHRRSKMCRTCRLVCRDWANACPLRCNLSFKDGSVWYRLEEEWRYLPSKYWAWTPRFEEWWVDCRPGQWYLKLVQPVDDTVRRSPKYSSTLSLLLSHDSISVRSISLTAAALPPELFRYICDAADTESWSSRLVCRYWNRLCTPHVFERVDVKKSPERIRVLWRHRTDPLIRHVKVVDNVPGYDKDSKFPWVHLLTQACTSTRSVWKRGRDQGEIYICGPLAGGHRTIRSVHFALPRSPPRSLSRGIKGLYIRDITFSKIEDLVHLVCELPDLETLFCGSGTTINPDSLPIQLPRRRPRTNRNRLRQVDIWPRYRDDPLSMALALYLSVYDVTSFFSDGEITIIFALVKPFHRSIAPKICYEESTHCNHSRRLYTTDDRDYRRPRSFQILRDVQRNHPILDCAIGCRNTDAKDLGCWIQLDVEFDKIRGLVWQANFVFGFEDRKPMIEFATNILEKMPSISKFASVRYGIRDNRPSKPDRWFQASLDSEELTGTPKKYLWEVYS